MTMYKVLVMLWYTFFHYKSGDSAMHDMMLVFSETPDPKMHTRRYNCKATVKIAMLIYTGSHLL